MSARGNGCEARRFDRATISISSRSMHVVDRNELRGSVEPAGGGRGDVDREGREGREVIACQVLLASI